MQEKKPIPYIDVENVIPNDKSATKCAPHLEFSNGSCIPLELLIKMAESYNKYNENNNSDNKLIKLDSIWEE